MRVGGRGLGEWQGQMNWKGQMKRTHRDKDLKVVRTTKGLSKTMSATEMGSYPAHLSDCL